VSARNRGTDPRSAWPYALRLLKASLQELDSSNVKARTAAELALGRKRSGRLSTQYGTVDLVGRACLHSGANTQVVIGLSALLPRSWVGGASSFAGIAQEKPDPV